MWLLFAAVVMVCFVMCVVAIIGVLVCVGCCCVLLCVVEVRCCVV